MAERERAKATYKQAEEERGEAKMKIFEEQRAREAELKAKLAAGQPP